MEIDKIITDPRQLRVPSAETTPEQVEDLNLVERLKTANKNAWTSGCGLAAIQIGIPLRFAWFTFKGKEETLMNPKIVMGIGKTKGDEGCLSIPDKWFPIERYHEIEYISHGKKKKAKGFKARIIQHEIDHMDGIIISEKKGE